MKHNILQQAFARLLLGTAYADRLLLLETQLVELEALVRQQRAWIVAACYASSVNKPLPPLPYH